MKGGSWQGPADAHLPIGLCAGPALALGLVSVLESIMPASTAHSVPGSRSVPLPAPHTLTPAWSTS